MAGIPEGQKSYRLRANSIIVIVNDLHVDIHPIIQQPVTAAKLPRHDLWSECHIQVESVAGVDMLCLWLVGSASYPHFYSVDNYLFQQLVKKALRYHFPKLGISIGTPLEVAISQQTGDVNAIRILILYCMA